MTLTKIFLAILTALNLYFGSRFFLNVINVLQTSKYSKSATMVFALLFLTMGIAGIYFIFFKPNNKLALWTGVGPWLLALGFFVV